MIFAAVAAGLALLSTLAIWSYGRFARSVQGPVSTALRERGEPTALDEAVDPLMKGAQGSSGLLLISSNLDAFAARALSARNAGRSLDLLYYIWHDDLTGRLLTHEVVAAADRGVRVRLLLDDINARGADPAYLALDSHPNIELRLFNPTRARDAGLRRGIEMVLRAFSATRRMHNKAWIADGRLAIVGGRNVGDEYFDAAEDANFRDLDMMLFGDLVPQMETVFDAYWNSPSAVPIKALAKGRRADIDAMRTRLADTVNAETTRPYFDRIRSRFSVNSLIDQMDIHWTNDAGIVSDPPEKTLGINRGNWLMSRLLPVLSEAKLALDITSPYFVPGTEGIEALKAMRERGVAIRILTNSLAATDVAAVHGGYAPARKPLLEAGLDLYELRPDVGHRDLSLFGSSNASLHTKAFTVDGRNGFVGSFNFDPRSVALNTEMGVLFTQPVLVAAMKTLFEQEIGLDLSYRLFLEDGKLRWAARENNKPTVYRKEPKAGIFRRMIATLTGILPIQSQL